MKYYKESLVLHDVRREAELIDHLSYSGQASEEELKQINRAAKNIKYIAEKFTSLEKIKNQRLKTYPIKFSVAEFIFELKKEIEILFPELLKRLVWEVDTSRTILADPLYIRSLFLNLLENSYLHGCEDVKLKLNFNRSDMEVCLSNIRNEKNDFGFEDVQIGQGLTIVKGLVEAMQGDYSVAVKNNRWVTKIKLPCGENS